MTFGLREWAGSDPAGFSSFPKRQTCQLLILVSDTGVGLPRRQEDQIFNAFFTTKPHGTGMGLRISRSIVESHGGHLWAADNSRCGASFYITLPTRFDAA